MITKRTIGIIQLILGVVIFVLGIVGLFVVKDIYGKLNNFGGDTTLVMVVNYVGFINTALASGLGIVLSLLFITQGLANTSKL